MCKSIYSALLSARKYYSAAQTCCSLHTNIRQFYCLTKINFRNTDTEYLTQTEYTLVEKYGGNLGTGPITWPNQATISYTRQ